MRILPIRPCGTSRVLLHAVKCYDMGPSRFTSHPRGRCAADFLSPLKYIALAGFKPATFGSSGKHTNHYTTKATNNMIVIVYIRVTIIGVRPTWLHYVWKIPRRSFLLPPTVNEVCSHLITGHMSSDQSQHELKHTEQTRRVKMILLF
jgi:hypothetical protein